MSTSPASLFRLLVALVVCGTAVGAAGTPSRAQSDTTVIRVGASTDDAVRPVLYAAAGGLFKREGLNVEIVKLTNGAAVAAAVAGGSIQIGKGSALTPILAYAKGLPFTVTADLGDYSSASPDTAMIAGKDSPIQGVHDLVGKTIGVIGLQDFNSLAIQNWLQQNGVDPTQVKFIEIPNSASLAAIEEGRIDATLVLEPTYSRAMQAQKFKVIGYPWTALAKRFSEATLFSTVAWANAHKEQMLKFNRAIRDAAAYISTHEEETKPLAAEYAGFDVATLKGFHPQQRPTVLSAADLQPVIDAAAKYKLIPKAFPARDIICSCAITSR